MIKLKILLISLLLVWSLAPCSSYAGHDGMFDTIAAASKKTVKVTFDANGGYFDFYVDGHKTKKEVEKYKIGDLYDYDAGIPIYRKNYAFQGWYTEKKGGRWVPDYEKVTKEKNHTLYARWAKVHRGYPKDRFYAVDSAYKAGLWPKGDKKHSRENYRTWGCWVVRYYYSSFREGVTIDTTPLEERDAKGFKWRVELVHTYGGTPEWQSDYLEKHWDYLPLPDFIPRTQAELEQYYDKIYARSRAFKLDWFRGNYDNTEVYVLCG
jgi:uncharacterized repeat protein (TIGR02543 family)